LNAVDYAEIRPEVSGRIIEVRFKDGQPSGPATFSSSSIHDLLSGTAKAEANLVSARTKADFAQTEFGRQLPHQVAGHRTAYL